MVCCPPFALMQKVEPKNQGKPERLRLFCRPRTATVIPVYIISLLRSKQLVSLYFATFSKPHAFPLSVTNDRRCILLSFPVVQSYFKFMQDKALHHSVLLSTSQLLNPSTTL
jgi:hypothetical protein